MAIADSMKTITEDIIASYDLRVKALGDLVVDTRKTLDDTRRTIRNFAQDRKQMSKEQAKALADFVADLTKNVGGMIRGFQRDHKAMAQNLKAKADDLKEGLRKGENERLKDFRGVMDGIRESIKEIETDAKEIQAYAKNKLKEFSAAHTDMSKVLKKDLAKYVGDIVSDVRGLLGEYGSDMKKAKGAWQSMSSTLAKSRKGGIMPRIEAGEEVTTVKEAVAKKKPRRKRAKRRGKRG